MAGRFAWWKTNLGASAPILAADPGLVAGGALTAAEVGLLTVVPGLAHVLVLAANAGLTPGRDGSPDLKRSLAHANHTVPQRAKSLAQTLVSPAPRADPKSKRDTTPEVPPRRNLPLGSLEAARTPVRRAATTNIPQRFPPSRTVSSPSPQPSAPPPAPGHTLDPDRPPKIDHFCNDVQN